METAVKLIKLINGETIIGLTDATTEKVASSDVFTIADPVTVKTFKHSEDGYVYESFIMQKWISLAAESTMNIPSYHVVTIVDVKPTFVDHYQKFLAETVIGNDVIFDEIPDDHPHDELDDFLEELEDFEDEALDDRPKPTYH